MVAPRVDQRRRALSGFRACQELCLCDSKVNDWKDLNDIEFCAFWYYRDVNNSIKTEPPAFSCLAKHWGSFIS